MQHLVPALWEMTLPLMSHETLLTFMSPSSSLHWAYSCMKFQFYLLIKNPWGQMKKPRHFFHDVWRHCLTSEAEVLQPHLQNSVIDTWYVMTTPVSHQMGFGLFSVENPARFSILLINLKSSCPNLSSGYRHGYHHFYLVSGSWIKNLILDLSHLWDTTL